MVSPSAVTARTRPPAVNISLRSEERRVGKECRSSGSSEYSSRRRHTRYIGDWSSDVCSSDLSNSTLRLLLAGHRAESNISPVVTTVEMDARYAFVSESARGRDGFSECGHGQDTATGG